MDLSNLKKAINDYNIELASSIIVDLYIHEQRNFKKALLLSNSLPEPLNRDFTEENLKAFIDTFCMAAMELLNRGKDISFFMKQILEIIFAIKSIYKNSKSNLDRLERNEFSKYTLSQQIQMYCIYIEDQNRLSNTMLIDKEYITGMERELANHKADNVKGANVSLADNFEFTLEIADTLFRLLYFKSGRNTEQQENFNHEGIWPYEISSLEEIMHLASQRILLNSTWGKFKYRDWNVLINNTKFEENFLSFVPQVKENYMKELIGINRYKYQMYANFYKGNKENLNNNYHIKYVEDCSKMIDVNNIETLFELPKEKYFPATEFIKPFIEVQMNLVDEIYLRVEYDGLNIEEYIKGFEYLYTIASIYKNSVLLDFDEKDKYQYKKLSPIVHIEKFIEHFKNLYNIENTSAEKIINSFVFNSKTKMDIFSQPLIYVGKDNVVFCPTLVAQMNMNRIIQLRAMDFEIDVSEKGEEFERNLRFILSYNDHIKVNTNKIEFKAYDERDIEFDFIGMFEDYLLLIEFKHIKLPYSEKQYKNAFDTIKYGVDQVNRREKVIKNDWKTIQEMCSFDLPDEPIEENKILKLVCTNIFNFSTIIHDGVSIIDSSSLLKFFMAPEIQGVAISEEVTEVFKRNLWINKYPTVTEFIEYLQCPIAIEPYITCYNETFKPIPKVNEDDYNILFFDYELIKDPYEFLYKAPKIINHKAMSIKIGRNEKCPCQSGVKYKKCCGK